MSKRSIVLIISAFLLIWVVSHIPGIRYGTTDLPLHQSYVGDEQSPVNGALHMLQEKSLLGLRNKWTVYYGPTFSTLAILSVLADAAVKFVKAEIKSANDYKHSILFDWGGIVVGIRTTALLFATIFLLALYHFFKPRQEDNFSYDALIVTSLMAINFYFFEYSHFFKHWIFIISALGIQWLTLKKIVEGGEKKWWILHATAVIFAAGVSYISLANLIMWVPHLVGWIRNRDWKRLCSFGRMTYAIVIAVLLIILWHPIILFRYFSMAGIGADVANTLGAQNPFNISFESISYYSTLVGLNHLALLLAGAVLVVSLWKTRIYAQKYTWVILLPGIFSFIFFAPAPHHEGRYMLPTVVALVVFVGYLLLEYKRQAYSKKVLYFVYILLAINALYHLAHIGKWMSVYADGPAEKTMLETVVERSSAGKKSILLVQSYIAGHIHTLEAYERYANTHGKSGLNLYKEILSRPLPREYHPIDATYVREEYYRSHPELLQKYDQVVLLNTPRKEKNEINQFDYIDENIFRIWRYREVLPNYIFVK